MDIKDKIFLAEFLGWIDVYKRYNQEPSKMLLNWEPDKNHKQFNDIWEKLSLNQQINIFRRSVELNDNEVMNSTHAMKFTSMVLNEEKLNIVIHHVVDILKEEK